MLRVSILLLAMVASLSALCCAQDRALISGDAEDKQDTPVAGVQVTLRNESLRVQRTTTTNADGYYFFAEVGPAEGYLITATAPGLTFSPSSVKSDVEVGETRDILPSFIGEGPGAPPRPITAIDNTSGGPKHVLGQRKQRHCNRTRAAEWRQPAHGRVQFCHWPRVSIGGLP